MEWLNGSFRDESSNPNGFLSLYDAKEISDLVNAVSPDGQCPDFPGNVIRGGSWGDMKADLRSAARRGRPRSSDISGVTFPDQGFRLAQDVK